MSDLARSYIEQATIAGDLIVISSIMFAATALYLNVPGITRDDKIQASDLQTI